MKNLTKYLIAVITVMMINNVVKAQFCVTCSEGDAGVNKTICCCGGSVTIGGSPTASPNNCNASFSWSPTTGLNSATAGNPVASPCVTTTYSVTVTYPGGCHCKLDVGCNCTVNPPTGCTGYVASSTTTLSQVTVTVNSTCCRIANPNLQKEVESPKIKFVPKQTAGMYNLELIEPTSNTSVHIYDSSGNSVFGNPDVITGNLDLDISAEMKGDYYVQVKSNDEVVMYKKFTF